MAGDGEFSAERYNGLLEDGVRMKEEITDHLLAQLFADGYPPFSVPVPDERAEFEQLDFAKLSGDPRFIGSRKAQERHAALAVRYGQPAQLPGTGLLG